MLSRIASRAVRSAAASRIPPSATRWPPRSPALSSILARGMARDRSSGSPRFSSPKSTSKHPSQSQQASASIPDADEPPTTDSQATPKREPVGPTRTGSPRVPSSEEPATEPFSPPPAAPGADASQPDGKIPLSSLPDLTQGIPSTLEYETAGSSSRSSLAAIDEEAPSAGGRGKGELPASAYISSSERRRQALANWAFGISATLVVVGTVFSGRNWNEEDERRHPDVPNGWGLRLWWNRAITRTREVLTYYHEPAFEKLLPDPDPMFERPYTLCISLEDMLVHSEWSREHGWRVAKRPGADYFLRYLSQYYELVLFTSVPFGIGEPILRKLDPYHFITWPLWREATKYKDGEIVKDLSYLNRDLSKVIVIDTNRGHVSAQPENAIVLPKWTGDVKDNDLVALIPFLEYIFTMQYGDVRKILKSFEGSHIPTEFARREAIARAEFQKQLEAGSGKNSRQARSGIGSLGNLLGLKPSKMSLMVQPEGESDPGEEFAKGKMLQDIARERGQRNYEHMERQVREMGETWLKEEAAMQEKAQKEAMQSMKSSFIGWFVNPEEGAAPKSPTEETKKP